MPTKPSTMHTLNHPKFNMNVYIYYAIIKFIIKTMNKNSGISLFFLYAFSVLHMTWKKSECSFSNN